MGFKVEVDVKTCWHIHLPHELKTFFGRDTIGMYSASIAFTHQVAEGSSVRLGQAIGRNGHGLSATRKIEGQLFRHPSPLVYGLACLRFDISHVVGINFDNLTLDRNIMFSGVLLQDQTQSFSYRLRLFCANQNHMSRLQAEDWKQIGDRLISHQRDQCLVLTHRTNPSCA